MVIVARAGQYYPSIQRYASKASDMSAEESFDLEPYLFQFAESKEREYFEDYVTLQASAVGGDERLCNSTDMALVWVIPNKT